MQELAIQGASISAITIAIVQLVKGYIPPRFVPLLPIGVALVLSVIASLVNGSVDIVQGILAGLISGLTAAGLYDQKKLMVK